MMHLRPAPRATFNASTTSGRRVDHAKQPNEHEILLDGFRGYACRDFLQRAKCHCEHAQRVARHVAILLEYRLAHVAIQAKGLAGFQPLAAEIEDDIGCALDEGDDRRGAEARDDSPGMRALDAVDRGHPLLVGIEGHLVDPGQRLFELPTLITALRRGGAPRAL